MNSTVQVHARSFMHLLEQCRQHWGSSRKPALPYGAALGSNGHWQWGSGDNKVATASVLTAVAVGRR